MGIDGEALLARLGGNRSLARQIVEKLASSMPALLQDLERASFQKNTSEIKRCAHSVKGMAGNLTASVLADLAGQLEELAGAGEIAQIGPVLRSLVRESRCVQVDLQKWAAEL